MRSPFIDKAIEIIFKELNGIISENDFTEYIAKRNINDKLTQTDFKIFNADKLSRVVLEQYTINSKAYGVVLNIYPKPEYGIPIFSFQLGGQIPDRVIFVLDIIPVVKTENMSKINDLYNKYVSIIKTLGTSQEWMKEISSPNSLVCQYQHVDANIIVEALSDYLITWRNIFYKQAMSSLDNEIRITAIDNILKFKKVLHANDAGLDIYLRNFGKAMSETIEDASFGADPPLTPVIEINNAVETAKPENTDDNNIKWAKEAEQYLLDAPKFVRTKIKANAENKAAEMGIKEITIDFINNLRK